MSRLSEGPGLSAIPPSPRIPNIPKKGDTPMPLRPALTVEEDIEEIEGQIEKGLEWVFGRMSEKEKAQAEEKVKIEKEQKRFLDDFVAPLFFGLSQKISGKDGLKKSDVEAWKKICFNLFTSKPSEDAIKLIPVQTGASIDELRDAKEALDRTFAIIDGRLKTPGITQELVDATKIGRDYLQRMHLRIGGEMCRKALQCDAANPTMFVRGWKLVNLPSSIAKVREGSSNEFVVGEILGFRKNDPMNFIVTFPPNKNGYKMGERDVSWLELFMVNRDPDHPQLLKHPELAMKVKAQNIANGRK